MNKGPKYRIPSLIDFHSCRSQVAEAIQNVSIKWCRREHVESNALSFWKKHILDIIDKHISFYSSNEYLLPPRPKISFRYLKKGLQDFHSKYVFVPADKASNNVIII